MIRWTTSILILAIFTQPVAFFAQEAVTVTGVVIDGLTDVPIPNVRVDSGLEEVTTGPAGRFSIILRNGEINLRFRAEGYVEITLLVDGEDFEVQMFQNTFTETVEVVSEELVQQRPSSSEISSEEIFRIAGSVDNIFRTLDTLPGVAATNDFQGRLAVRGGTPDQNLTVMDGVEVHNPYRLFGITSAFNPETIENFRLTAGGFGVAYGDRLSSLLIVDNRPGKRDFQGSTSLSITDGNLVLEGQTPILNSGTWLFSARRTYYDLLIGRLQDQKFPSFTDLQIQTGWEFGPGHRFTLMGLHSVEDADFDIDLNRENRHDENVSFGSDIKNDLVSARIDALLGSRTTSKTIVSWYRNREFVDFNGTIRAEAKRSNDPDDNVGFGRNTIKFDRLISVRDISARQEFNVIVSPKHFFSVGFEIHRLNTGVELMIDGDRNENEANASSIRGGQSLADKFKSLLEGIRGGFWIQDIYKPSSQLAVEFGLRLDRSTINERGTVSPRIAANYALGDHTRARAAVGLYTQSPGYEKLTQSDYFIDLSNARRLKLLYEKSTHVVVGLERDLTSALTARVEGFYKGFNDLLVGRVETENERLSRISQYDFPKDLQSSVPTAPLITTNPTNSAGGDAYGFDIYLEHTDPLAPLTGWLSYAWGRSNRESYGQNYAFEYDRRNAFSAVGRYQFTDGWDLASTIRVANGFPYTPPVGLRISAVEDGRGKLVPSTDSNGNLLYTIDYGGMENLNSGRLPYYARVDLRTTYRPGGTTGRWSLYLEVINLLGRDNPIAVEPQLTYDPGSDKPRLSEVSSEGFPRIPTFGVRFRF